MKRFLQLFTLLVVLGGTALAQNAENTVRCVESDPDNYYFGHGYENSYNKSRQSALSNLISSISVVVSSRFDKTTSIVRDGQEMTQKEDVNNVIKTYSNASELRNVQTLQLTKPDEKPCHVFCYVSRKEVEQMFEMRKEKVLTYLEAAKKFEDKLKIADALQYYYWGMQLLKTHPDCHNITFVDERDGKEKPLLIWLNKKISAILDEVDFEVVNISENGGWNQVELSVTYKGQAVKNCEYTYFTGNNWTPPVRAKDGRGIAEFSTLPDNLLVSVEYAFENEAQNIDPELRDIMETMDKVIYKTDDHSISLAKAKNNQGKSKSGTEVPEQHPEALVAQTSLMKTTNKQAFGEVSEDEKNTCLSVMAVVEKAVKGKNSALAANCFTKEGMEMFDQLIRYGNVSIIGKPQYAFLKTDDAIFCRSMPVQFKFQNSGKTIIEDVAFRFDAKGEKIESVAFTLNKEGENDILRHQKWNDTSRLKLVEFLENYQTAYALKRIDYLESIFSEDALIIVGTKLQKNPNPEVKIHLSDNYRLVQKTKQEYFASLRRVFASKEYVNLQLKDNEILKAGNGEEIYCIQIRQLYSSNNYADQGYLFLMVDLRNEQLPVIHVRAWQEEKDPNFGLINCGDFSF